MASSISGGGSPNCNDILLKQLNDLEVIAKHYTDPNAPLEAADVSAIKYIKESFEMYSGLVKFHNFYGEDATHNSLSKVIKLLDMKDVSGGYCIARITAVSNIINKLIGQKDVPSRLKERRLSETFPTSGAPSAKSVVPAGRTQEPEPGKGRMPKIEESEKEDEEEEEVKVSVEKEVEKAKDSGVGTKFKEWLKRKTSRSTSKSEAPKTTRSTSKSVSEARADLETEAKQLLTKLEARIAKHEDYDAEQLRKNVDLEGLKKLYDQGVNNPNSSVLRHIVAKLKMIDHFEVENLRCYHGNMTMDQAYKLLQKEKEKLTPGNGLYFLYWDEEFGKMCVVGKRMIEVKDPKTNKVHWREGPIFRWLFTLNKENQLCIIEEQNIRKLESPFSDFVFNDYPECRPLFPSPLRNKPDI